MVSMLLHRIVVIIAVLALTASTGASDEETTVHVAATAHTGAAQARMTDGSAANPFQSLQDAKEHIIRLHSRGSNGVAHHAHVRRVLIQPGQYLPLAIDHVALSGVEWRGAGANTTSISGGIEIPRNLFKPWEAVPGAFVASIAGLGAADLGAMVSGNEVSDCQNDKVGLSYDGSSMVNARWPNEEPAGTTAPNPWHWARAMGGCARAADGSSTFTMNISGDPHFPAFDKWSAEQDPFVHGYWEWDWGDSYARVAKVQHRGDTVEVAYRSAPTCKPGARWMAVNLLCELDSPREYYIDTENLLVYFFPPEPPTGVQGPPIVLMYRAGGVLNVTAAATNVTITDISIINGRHAGILAPGAIGLHIARVSVHAHGTHGIVMTGALGGGVAQSEVYAVGCSGIRATAGVAETLVAGGLVVAHNHVHHVAQWKRSYMPGIYWGGVGNRFVGNIVEQHPHACFVGGGDFEDGVDNVFDGNTIRACAFETLDAGGFYSSGQHGTAFTNRGNVLRGNQFSQILNHAEGTGVQQASVQAVYLDDQQSGWTVTDNTFTDCTVCSFIGGGRRNIITGNRFVRCGTVQYLNNQGVSDPSENGAGMIHCTEVAAPFTTTCSTGAATWMATKGPAAVTWARRWPEMTQIMEDNPGRPAHNIVANNTFCRNFSAPVHEFISSNVNPSCPNLGPACVQILADWRVVVSNNIETHDC